MNNINDQKAQIQIFQFLEYQNSVENEIDKQKKMLSTLLEQKKKLYIEKIIHQKQIQNTQQKQIEEQTQKIDEQFTQIKDKTNKENQISNLQQLLDYQAKQNKMIEEFIDQSSSKNSTHIILQEKVIKLQSDIDSIKEERDMKEKLITQLQQLSGVYLEYDGYQKILEIQLEHNCNVQIQIKLEDKLKIHNITPKNEQYYQFIKEFNQDNKLDKLIQKIYQYN